MAKEIIRRIKEDLIFIPSIYLEEEKPLKFKFKLLSNKEIVKIDDQLSAYNVFDNKIVLATNEINYDIALKNLTGWENLVVEGKELMNDATISIEDFNLIEELVELGNYIYIVSKYPDSKIEYK